MKTNRLPKSIKHLPIKLKTEYYRITYFNQVMGFHKDSFKYEFYVNDKLIFSGNDYCPSPMWIPKNGWYDTLPMKAVKDLLAFLTLQPGDTDPDYFKDYTKEQLEFCQSDLAEEIKLLIMD